MSRNAGILIALGVALLFGASTPLPKLALSSANPLLVAGPALFRLGHCDPPGEPHAYHHKHARLARLRQR
jgi:hypothetical protein